MNLPPIILPPTSPNLPDFRMAINVQSAERCGEVWPKSKGRTQAQKQGYRYENRVARELLAHANRGHFTRLEHNPWFSFRDIYGSGNCSPDFLLWIDQATVIIVEVKLTWVEVAAHKLAELYYPVITEALGVNAWPLIICRNLGPKSPKPKHSLREAMASEFRLLHWAELGTIPW